MGQSMLARIPVGKPKVLLLGISYPSVEKQMEKHGFESDLLVHKDASVDQAIECVRRGILTEMDARDLARCVATEQACDVDAYSSSREIGAVYRDDRHVYGDFNNRNFCKTLKKAFGQDVQFSQVILDYYWMPSGWLVTRYVVVEKRIRGTKDEAKDEAKEAERHCLIHTFSFIDGQRLFFSKRYQILFA